MTQANNKFPAHEMARLFSEQNCEGTDNFTEVQIYKQLTQEFNQLRALADEMAEAIENMQFHIEVLEAVATGDFSKMELAMATANLLTASQTADAVLIKYNETVGGEMLKTDFIVIDAVKQEMRCNHCKETEPMSIVNGRRIELLMFISDAENNKTKIIRGIMKVYELINKLNQASEESEVFVSVIGVPSLKQVYDNTLKVRNIKHTKNQIIIFCE
jgi:hypothetical protein